MITGKVKVRAILQSLLRISMVFFALIAIGWIVMILNDKYAEHTNKNKSAYYNTFSGKQHPWKFRNEISEEEAKSKLAYFYVEYNQEGNIFRIVKYLQNGISIFTINYEYNSAGYLKNVVSVNNPEFGISRDGI